MSIPQLATFNQDDVVHRKRISETVNEILRQFNIEATFYGPVTFEGEVTFEVTATFEGMINAGGINLTGSTIPTNGCYLASANTLALSTNSTLALSISSTQVVSISDAGTMREAGFRSLPSRTFTSSDSTAAADNGKLLYKSTGGGDTLTIDSDFGVAGYITTVVNAGSGSLTIAESLSGTLSWMAGSGSISTGSRTLAIGGVCTIYMIDATNAFIWGTGIT